jgi:hypothetical protein
MGLALVALGIPGYLWWSLTNKSAPQACPASSEAL